MKKTEIEKKIAQTTERIEELEEAIKKLDEEIDREKKASSRSSTDATMGLFMMNNSSAMRTMGTYKYVNGTMQGGVHRSNVSRLENEKQFKSSQLYDEKRRLQSLKKELEFESRLDAVLIDSKDGLFVEGDKSKTNMLAGMYEILNQYVADYNAMLSDGEVKKYCELVSQIMQDPGYEKLPENNKRNLGELNMAVHSDTTYYDRFFDQIVVGDKILVGGDFVANSIHDEEDMIRFYTRKSEEQKVKAGMFEPNGLGRVLPKARQKQEEEFKMEIKHEIDACERRIEYAHDEIKKYESVRTKFIKPSEPFFMVVKKIVELEGDTDVRVFKEHGEKYRQDIQNQTILKHSSNYGDHIAMAIEKVRPVLDKLGVKLTREQLLEAIFNSQYHSDLVAELKNAGYKLSKAEAEKAQATQLGEE